MPLFHSALARKLGVFASFTREELACLAEVQSEPIVVKRGKELLQEGQYGQKVFIIQSGWASCYKDLPDGSRQIINIPIPGDCVGLRSVLLKTSDHAFSALTDAELCTIDAPRLMRLFDDFPRIREAFMRSGARDEAMAVERLVGLGRRTAIGRTAHFFMELADRLMLVGLATPTEYKCPLNQYVLADALGLSAIHVNRVLRALREHNLLSLRSGTLRIHDLQNLTKLASYHRLNIRQWHTEEADAN